MLDYALLDALAAVVREGSFERAARALHVTPSAVSQRVRLLEERIGQVLVLRGSPCTATPAGLQLVRHAERVSLLEATLREELPALATDGAGRATLAVAVNADSLATWFIAAGAAFADETGVLLDLSLDDQDHTAERLKSGAVLAAVTGLATPVAGCRSVALGAMRYLPTASPAFVARHFAAGVNAESLALAPCLTFNAKDRLQEQWLEREHGLTAPPPRHWLPSTQAFVDGCRAGLGWGLNPAALVGPLIAAGTLVAIGAPLLVPLAWQHSRRAGPLLDRLTDRVVAAARASLEGSA